MSVRVTMRIFSLQSNPTWVLTAEQERAFRDWYGRAQAQAKAFVTGGGVWAGPAALGTGYRGLDVSIDGGAPVRFSAAQMLSLFGSPDGPSDPIDQWLFRADASRLRAEFGFKLDVTRAPIGSIRGLPASCSSAQLLCGPVGFPGPGTFWDHDHPDPRRPQAGSTRTNTCYNYAVNVPSTRTRMPRLNGRDRGVWNATQLRTALEQDHLRFAGCDLPAACPRDTSATYIAPMIHVTSATDPVGDLHFLRLDRDGVWSQKYDTEPISNTDDSKPPRRMTDLCQARLAVDFRFVGFFEVNDDTRHHLQERGSPLFALGAGQADIRFVAG